MRSTLPKEHLRPCVAAGRQRSGWSSNQPSAFAPCTSLELLVPLAYSVKTEIRRLGLRKNAEASHGVRPKIHWRERKALRAQIHTASESHPNKPAIPAALLEPTLLGRLGCATGFPPVVQFDWA